MLYTRVPTQNKALHVYLYFGIDFSQGFCNMTISYNAQIQKKPGSLIHSSKKSSSSLTALITTFELRARTQQDSSYNCAGPLAATASETII